MLVFISDLHFRDDERLTVRTVAIDHFLKKNLIPQVQDAMQSSAKPELEVVFLGDIFDINRSSFWDSYEAKGVYPWSNWLKLPRLHGRRNGAAGPTRMVSQIDPEFERNISCVLDRIIDANRENLKRLKDFKNPQSHWWNGCAVRPQAITYRFVVGNHDRLVQYSPSIRAKVKAALDLPDDISQPFPWVYVNPMYSVIGLHGHVFDKNNFSGGKDELPKDFRTDPLYDYPSLGDAVTVMFGQRIVQTFRDKLETAHSSALDFLPQTSPSLTQSLAIIDEVRPQRAILTWLKCFKEYQQPGVARMLEESVLETIDQFLNDPFVRSRLPKLLVLGEQLILRPLRFLGFQLSLDRAVQLFNLAGGGSPDPAKDEKEICHAAGCGAFRDWQTEYCKTNNCPRPRYLVLGHTHRPMVLPLTGSLRGRQEDSPDSESLYFNCGTWSGVVDQGRLDPETFTYRSQICHVIFYSPDEDVSDHGKNCWEFLMGNLRTVPVDRSSLAASPRSGSAENQKV